jgi:hypothetical protein
MTEQNHSREPWHAEGHCVYDADGKIVFTGSATATTKQQFANAKLAAAAPPVVNLLIRAIEASGFEISGATDMRVAEHGEPAWVCEARATLAKAGA